MEAIKDAVFIPRDLAIVTVHLALDFSGVLVCRDVMDEAGDHLHGLLTAQMQMHGGVGTLVDWQFAENTVRMVQAPAAEVYEEGEAFARLNARLQIEGTKGRARPLHVHLVFHDLDQHGEGCQCGKCDQRGRSFAYAVYQVGATDPLETFYSPGSAGSEQAAKAYCRERGYIVVDRPMPLWRQLKLIPVRDGQIREPFHAWRGGTDLKTIYEWFQTVFDVQVHNLMEGCG